jgi:S-adenosylmethionine-diacylgycerolhomoserine-N-methlytransferase
MTRHRQNASSFHPSSAIERYYRFHAKIYDVTRWSFLFGRDALIRAIALTSRTPTHILEVGCGTGHNLVSLCHTFPSATVVGLDLSADMLGQAQKKIDHLGLQVHLLSRAYDRPLQPLRPFDVILFSYVLTMINPGWERALSSAQQDLAQNGMIAVVDFHDSPWSFFRRWMGLNHVRIDGSVAPYLQSHFHPYLFEIRRAYGGLWTYLTFIGGKEPPVATSRGT